MRLYEYEGKKILAESGIAIPRAILVAQSSECDMWKLFPCVVKAQTLFGNRKEKGLIKFADNVTELKNITADFLQDHAHVLIEERMSFEEEHYLAIRYDTATRTPVLLYSKEGGSGIEHRGKLVQVEIDPLTFKALDTDIPVDGQLLQTLTDLFFSNDCTLLEVNPLVKVKDDWIALDAKVELDDTAESRHSEWKEYAPRTLFARQPTHMEQKAKEINAMDHRGSAGASFFEFDGTIGILASGGGASLVAMDGLLASGLTPANYTEYSGNPTREKVRELSKLVLSKTGLEGLWVVGGNANFTDIFETLSGVMDALEVSKLPLGFPVIIRRGGPRWEEAFDSLRERSKDLGIAIQFFGPDYPMLETTSVLVEAVEKFRKEKK